MEIRRTEEADLKTVLELYAQARAFMRETGNPDQWGDSKPTEAMIREDIRLGRSWVAEESGEILAVFAFLRDGEPTYGKIRGAWHREEPYGTIHRIAARRGHGAASACFRWCASQMPYLRIDTHRQNAPMQHRLEKEGFRYCGIIWLEDRSERLAFDRFSPEAGIDTKS